jgi:hypothetical protein
MHYNYFRDYEAASGRYAQSDPAGILVGEFDSYLYGWADPTGFTDAYGLAPTVWQRCGCTIYGTLQSSNSQGHWFRTGRWVIEQIRCGATEIFLDRAWTTMTGNPGALRKRPDGGARFPSGCLNTCQTPSRSDDETKLLQRQLDGRGASWLAVAPAECLRAQT